MSKKIKFFSVTFLVCILLSGCMDVIDLTDEQSTLIAEYSAQLLLKYDRGYKDRIDDGEKRLEDYQNAQDVSSEDMNLTTQEQEVTTQEISTQEASTQVIESQPDDTETDEIQSNPNDAESDTPDVEKEVGTQGDIAKIVGTHDVSITYKDYIITDQYPATDEDGNFICLEASRGHKLLVVRFRVCNNLDEQTNLSLIDQVIDYRIVCNGNKAAKPMLTILMDDLGTLETTLKPNEEQEAVLVFQISDSMTKSIDSIELKIQYNDADNIIRIK